MYHQQKSIAEKWFKAFNEHHLENLLSLYAGNAVHTSPKLRERHPETHGLVKGKDALRTWWSDAFQRIPTLHYEVKTLTADESRVFMEYIRKADGEGDMNVAEVLEIQNGLIVASRVYHG